MDYTLGATVLYAENVGVQYEGRDIIKNVNIIEKDVIRENHITGQIVAIVGRSGRGKSTLFKVLTGLVKPCSGTILIPQHDDPTKAKVVEEGDVGFVNQKYTLFRNKTVKEALLFALRNSKLTKEEKETKIYSSVASWGLADHVDKYPNQLSGGQRQRVAILEQMFSSETFIILDEPFSGLDVGNIEQVKSAFKDISSANEFNTIIFSTHDLELAVELADSIYVVGYPTVEGKLQDYGTIIKNYDLKEMGLAWNNEMTVTHYDLVHKIKDDLLNS